MPATDREPSPAVAPPAPLPAGRALALVLAVALALRVWEAVRTPLWFDEIFSLWVARLPVPDLLQALAGDMHPPLHFALEHLWIAIGGAGALWLKSLAILFGLATVLALHRFAAEAFGAGVGLIAAALLALHRGHVYYSQEARSYGLLWLFYVLAAWMAWRWVERGRARDAALYVLCAAAALWTHYQAGFVLAFLGLWGVIALARTPRRLPAWVGLHVAAAALFAPQLPTFMIQLHRLGADHWLRPPTPEILLEVFRLLSFHLLPMIPVCVTLAVLPLLSPRLRRGAVLLWVAFVLPVLVAYLLSVNGARLFSGRYMMHALPAWCALVAAGIATPPWRSVRAVLGVGLIAVALRTGIVHPVLVEAQSLKRASAWLESHVRPGDLLVTADTHTWFFLRQNRPALGRQVLLLSTPGLPYFEGARFVPDSVRVRLEACDSLVAGRRWFGVRTDHGGIDSRPALARMLAAARGPIEGFGPVTVVAGQPE